MAKVYAVAATHRPDLDKMNDSIRLLGLPKGRVVVVSNGVDRPRAEEIPEATVVDYADLEYNMPHWWNVGLDEVSRRADGEPYEVFVFNADTGADHDVVVRLAEVLRENDLAATGPDRFNSIPAGQVIENHDLSPMNNMNHRMTGYAFVLRGELELRADPQFRHWYIDDDLEWQARHAGGVGMVGGLTVRHPYGGNPLTPVLAQWAVEDRERFQAKWGSYPH